MALAQGTPILLLDEPTTFLDLAHQCEVMDLLQHLNETEGRTIVAVLHDLNQACRYAHHLIAMKDGAVVATGRPTQVVTEQMVAEVFGLAVRWSPIRSPARRGSCRSGADAPRDRYATMPARRTDACHAVLGPAGRRRLARCRRRTPAAPSPVLLASV